VLSRTDNSALLAKARARILELETELARLSARDLLVPSLLTLGPFRAQLHLDVQRALRYGRPLSLAVLDIDRFRHLNLSRGYGVGDMVLTAVGELISASTRAHDLACRAGGDEFLLLLPETGVNEARGVIDRILVDAERVKAADQVGISLSAGLTALQPHGDADDLLGQAHAALELARADGGGRCTMSDELDVIDGATEALLGTTAEVVTALAQALEERDAYTGEHSESVVDLAGRVAEELALDGHEVKTIRSAALLHDIGKVGIPDEILHKAGPLDEREWEIMRQHPVVGERIMRAIPGMGAVARIVRHEHERWDGTGYPDGLAGEEIPIGARIILACDAYHAMTSDRPYRAAMSHHMAMSELTTNAGSQFDPNVVETLVGYLYGRRQAGRAAV
jgi:diguanylate cyclase (GGDEF)-like protein/putative nucleotidyltransferase with HDIG domain